MARLATPRFDIFGRKETVESFNEEVNSSSFITTTTNKSLSVLDDIWMLWPYKFDNNHFCLEITFWQTIEASGQTENACFIRWLPFPVFLFYVFKFM